MGKGEGGDEGLCTRTYGSTTSSTSTAARMERERSTCAGSAIARLASGLRSLGPQQPEERPGPTRDPHRRRMTGATNSWKVKIALVGKPGRTTTGRF